jgi:hypothetical protein
VNLPTCNEKLSSTSIKGANGEDCSQFVTTLDNRTSEDRKSFFSIRAWANSYGSKMNEVLSDFIYGCNHKIFQEL